MSAAMAFDVDGAAAGTFTVLLMEDGDRGGLMA
jgi:hypothetical protein